MSQVPRKSRGLRQIRRAASVFRMGGSTLIRLDPDGLRFITIPTEGGPASGRCASPPGQFSSIGLAASLGTRELVWVLE